jgi:hypothetical protein
MQCPYCLKHFHSKPVEYRLIEHPLKNYKLHKEVCPECHAFSLYLVTYSTAIVSSKVIESDLDKELVWPKTTIPRPVPTEVPSEIASDFKEAIIVQSISNKASAALSRRCLQHLLQDANPTMPKGNLAKEIDWVLTNGNLPSYIRTDIDAIRNLGNIATHPIENRLTGEIVEVEPGEAEWLLNVLEALFDFYYVQPKLQADRRAALDLKLQEAGKPPLKC